MILSCRYNVLLHIIVQVWFKSYSQNPMRQVTWSNRRTIATSFTHTVERLYMEVGGPLEGTSSATHTWFRLLQIGCGAFRFRALLEEGTGAGGTGIGIGGAGQAGNELELDLLGSSMGGGTTGECTGSGSCNSWSSESETMTVISSTTVDTGAWCWYSPATCVSSTRSTSWGMLSLSFTPSIMLLSSSLLAEDELLPLLLLLWACLLAAGAPLPRPRPRPLHECLGAGVLAVVSSATANLTNP